MIDKIYFLIFTLSVLIAIVSCGTAKIKNIFSDGFEDISYDDRFPYGWTTNQFRSSKNNAIFSIDYLTSHSGSKSALISIPQKNPIEPSVFNWVKRIDNLETNCIYELEGWIKTNGIEKSPYFEIQSWSVNKMLGTTSTVKRNPVTGTKNWQSIKTIFIVPAGTIKVLLFAGVTSETNNGGKVWFDDIQIKKIK